MEDLTTLIFDHGSGVSKAGFAGEEIPRVIYSKKVGHQYEIIDIEQQACCVVSHTTQMRRELIDLVHPIKNGNVTDWDSMEKLWHHTFFNELRISPEEHAILLTEPFSMSDTDKEKTAEILFETFGVPGIHMVNESILSLYITGRTSGVVLEVGEHSTRCVPIDDGKVLKDAAGLIGFAGKNLTDILQKMIWIKSGNYVKTETCREIKEQFCFVAQDFEQEREQYKQNPALKKNYKLPDGQLISLNEETFTCPEFLFNCPTIADKFELQGIQQLINSTVFKCGESLLEPMFRNIILSGGTCMLPGISQRIRTEVTRLTTHRTNTIIGSPKHRKYMVWVGASMLAAIPTFQESLVLRDKYKEKCYRSVTFPSVSSLVT